MRDRDKGREEGRSILDAEDVRTFSGRGNYPSVYDIIVELPFYRRAIDLHMQWIRSIEISGPLIIDAGGGSGIMSVEARRARPDADVYLFDVNPAMAEQARKHGLPGDKIVITDITDMSLKSEAVDHILSHSVVWALARPSAFFAEAWRVLRRRGTLAVSTVGENMHRYRRNFLEYLDYHLSAAVHRSAVTPEQKRTFLEQNERLTEVAKSPLSASELRELGENQGLAVEAAADCYVIDTPDGPRPYFYQMLYRKR
jgi:ubiquinone/menaquinone biosynthesis C-methylase UbiE